MKTFTAILLFALCIYTQSATAQTNCGITYGYDDSGNRILREVRVCDYQNGGGGGSGKRDLSSTDSTASQNLTEALFPNPVSGITNIVFSNTVTDAQITITDNLGRQVFSTVSSGSTIPLDMSHYPGGLYHVLVRASGQSFKNEVVKE